MDKKEEIGYIKKCIQCGTSLSHLQATKRAGCAFCYDMFCEEIDRLNGEFPLPFEGEGSDSLHSAGQLRYRLHQALHKEDYETAARIRDELAGIDEFSR
jgi:protein-arginine kinase activator protein McsA